MQIITSELSFYCLYTSSCQRYNKLLMYGSEMPRQPSPFYCLKVTARPQCYNTPMWIPPASYYAAISVPETVTDDSYKMRREKKEEKKKNWLCYIFQLPIYR